MGRSSQAISRSPYRIAVYTALSGLAMIGIFWLSTRPAASPRNTQTTNEGLRNSSQTRDRFQEVFELGWRFDGGAGNTAVEVVYFFPGLTQRLGEYAERSALQAETLQLIQSETDASLIPFTVNLQRNAPLDRELDWGNILTLRGDSQTYQFERFDVSAFPSGRDDILAGVVWFRRSGVEPKRLTLTLTNVPGNIKPTTMTWEVDALRLYDATPAEQNS